MPLSWKLQVWVLQANVYPKWLWLSGLNSWNWNQACLGIYEAGGTLEDGNTGGIYSVLFDEKLGNRAISCFLKTKETVDWYYCFLQAIPLIGNMIRIKVSLPQGYVEKFADVEMAFKHQSAFDPATRKEVCLEPLPEASTFNMYPLSTICNSFNLQE